MKRAKNKVKKMKYYNIIFSTFCGLLIIILLIIIFSAAGAKNIFPDIVVSILLIIAIASGGFLSGYLYCKQKRHKGILNGMLCGLIIYVAILMFGIVYMRKLPSLYFCKYMVILGLTGAIGGVLGVNSKIKKPPI